VALAFFVLTSSFNAHAQTEPLADIVVSKSGDEAVALGGQISYSPTAEPFQSPSVYSARLALQQRLCERWTVSLHKGASFRNCRNRYLRGEMQDLDAKFGRCRFSF
jgi:hypothetical protein